MLATEPLQHNSFVLSFHSFSEAARTDSLSLFFESNFRKSQFHKFIPPPRNLPLSSRTTSPYPSTQTSPICQDSLQKIAQPSPEHAHITQTTLPHLNHSGDNLEPCSSFTLPNNLFEGDVSEPDHKPAEKIYNADISMTKTPYPLPLISDFLKENEFSPQPLPPPLSLSHMPSTSLTLSSTLGDNCCPHYLTMFNPLNVGKDTIVGILCTKDCLVLTPSRISPQTMLGWTHSCHCYKQLNTLADDVVVAHIGGSIQENHLQDWFGIEKDHLTELGLQGYLKEFTKHVLL